MTRSGAGEVTSSSADSGRGGWLVDAALYGGSAAFAAGVASIADIPMQREWGWIALPTYVAATVAAAVGASWGRPSLAGRVVLAVCVFAGASLAPLLVASVARTHEGPGTNVQAEAIVIEEGADALLDGRDPYRAAHLQGPLEDRPPATRTHLPYMPGMLVFGMPRALFGHEPWTDGRVWLLACSSAAAAIAVGRLRVSAARRLAVLQVLFVLPTGAALAATGGDDGPVLALLLLGVVLADRRRPLASGLAAGLALAVKQIAILVIPLLAVTTPRGAERRRFLAAAGLAWLGIVAPFALWHPRSFVEDVVLFPLGLGTGPSPARTPTIGTLIEATVPGPSWIAVAAMVLALAATAFVVLVRRPPTDAGGAAARAAALVSVALALGPAVRAGLVVYPVNLLVWAWVLADRRSVVSGDPTTPTTRDLDSREGPPISSPHV